MTILFLVAYVLLVLNASTSAFVSVYGPLKLTVYVPVAYEEFANVFNTVAISSPVAIFVQEEFVNVTLYCVADELYTFRYLSDATIVYGTPETE